MQALERKTRRVYNQGMTFLNNFCAQADKYLDCVATQRRVVTNLLDRIRPIVSADVLEQAKELRAVTLAQQQRWFEAQDDLDDLQNAVLRRKQRYARRGMKVSADQVTYNVERFVIVSSYVFRLQSHVSTQILISNLSSPVTPPHPTPFSHYRQ